MNCFVIMPFSADFDDVYTVIKSAVESVAAEATGRCFRLDESQPAGRITDRLLSELRAATLCIADLTENKPNVMWELGFAMALEKPTLIVTQNKKALPFDVKDMQSIEYDRNHMASTLAIPLKKSVIDTLGALQDIPRVADAADSKAFGTLLNEVSELKHMLGAVMRTWKTDEAKLQQSPESELKSLAGHWINLEGGSHVYSRVVRGELVSPYCYGGDAELTGVYYGWRRVGNYWFARYRWVNSDISGFSFLRMESLEKMAGAWWSSEQAGPGGDTPPRKNGVPSSWVKQRNTPTPSWAEEFFRGVEHEGLASKLAQYS